MQNGCFRSRKETDAERKAELEKIAAVCRWVPANKPRNFWEAIQMYWTLLVSWIFGTEESYCKFLMFVGMG